MTRDNVLFVRLEIISNRTMSAISLSRQTHRNKIRTSYLLALSRHKVLEVRPVLHRTLMAMDELKIVSRCIAVPACE